MTEEERQDWVPSQEAAVKLGMSLRWLQELCKDGRMPCRYETETMPVTRTNIYVPKWYLEGKVEGRWARFLPSRRRKKRHDRDA